MVLLAAALLLLAPSAEEVTFGTTAAQRLRLLRHGNAGVRLHAAMLLGNARPEEALAGLIVALQDPDAGVRAQAAVSLARLRDERAVPALARRAAAEDSDRVLLSLLVAIGVTGGPYAGRIVLPFLEHPTREVRAAAAEALGHVGDSGQRDALLSTLRYEPDDPSFLVRSTVLAAFVNLGWVAEVKLAITELEAAGGLRHWMSRAAILGAIGAIRWEERTAFAQETLDHEEDPRVLAAAAGALARLGRLDAVAGHLSHPDPGVRRASLVALQEAGDPRATDAALRMVAGDPDLDVRFEAAITLAHLNHPGADRYLVDALRSANTLYWITALGLLEERHQRSFGRDPEAWERWLRERAKDPDRAKGAK